MNRTEALHILGLEDDATADDIKIAYRETVQILHPDKFAGNEKLQNRATEQFKRLQEAYDLLSSGAGGGRGGRGARRRPRRGLRPPGGKRATTAKSCGKKLEKQSRFCTERRREMRTAPACAHARRAAAYPPALACISAGFDGVPARLAAPCGRLGNML